MATEEATAAGLIAWLNSLDVADKVQSVADLVDGRVIWETLQKIDALSFPGKLPEEDVGENWVPRWNNLKGIEDAISVYLTEDCNIHLPLPSGAPDLKAIAQHASLYDTVALLKLVVVAAINCNDRIDFLTQMQELDTSTQEVLMRTAQEATEQDDESESPQRTPRTPERSIKASSAVTSPRSPRLDSDFAAEERLGRVLADNQRIAHEKRDVERQLDEAYTRYERLQASLNKCQEELKETNDRLTAVLAGKADGTSREARNETVIAQLEARVSTADTELEELRKANELLKIRAEKAQKLQDDYDEIKIERDRLSRKANAAEKYKQKLEASQDLEKENLSLRERVAELQGQVRHSDSTTMAKSDLQRENEELRKLFGVIEQDYNETADMKKRLEFDYQTLEARYHDRGEELRRHQTTIEDLQGRLLEVDEDAIPVQPVSDTARALGEAEEEEEVPAKEEVKEEDGDFAENEARRSAALVHEKDDDGVSEDELRAIMSAMRAQAQAGTASEREKAQKKLIVALERGRSKNKELTEHIKKQAELIQNLQSQPPSAPPAKVEEEEKPPTPPPKDDEPRPASPTPSEAEHDLEAASKVITNLKRELNLMTSAWYEQNKRMISGGMSTPRTRAPKSFLGRQRQAVEMIALGGQAR